MQKVIITNKGLELQRQIREEERENTFYKNIYKEKLQVKQPENQYFDLSKSNAVMSQVVNEVPQNVKSNGEKLFYNNTQKHFKRDRESFYEKEKKNRIRGVFRNYLVQRDSDYVEKRFKSINSEGQKEREEKEHLINKNVKALDPSQTTTNQFMQTVSKFIPPQVSCSNKMDKDMRINHLVQTQLNFEVRPVILENQGNSNVIDRMEKKRFQYMNETLGNFEKLKQQKQIDMQQDTQNIHIPKTEELFKDNIDKLDRIIDSYNYEKQRLQDRIKAYHHKKFESQWNEQKMNMINRERQRIEQMDQQTLSLEINKNIQ